MLDSVKTQTQEVPPVSVHGNAGFGNFRRDALAELAERRTELLGRLREPARDRPEGSWHPYGFASFVLGTLSIPNTIAYVHVWPKNFRGGVVAAPPLHRHSFDLISIVEDGTYADQLYQLTRVGSAEDLGLLDEQGVASEKVIDSVRGGRRYPISVAGKMHTFSRGQVVADDTWASVTAVGPGRRFGKGGVHAIPVGLYHSTIIPIDIACVTLCALRGVDGEPDAVIGNPQFPTWATGRRPIPDSEIDYVLEHVPDPASTALTPLLSAG